MLGEAPSAARRRKYQPPRSAVVIWSRMAVLLVVIAAVSMVWLMGGPKRSPSPVDSSPSGGPRQARSSVKHRHPELTMSDIVDYQPVEIPILGFDDDFAAANASRAPSAAVPREREPAAAARVSELVAHGAALLQSGHYDAAYAMCDEARRLDECGEGVLDCLAVCSLFSPRPHAPHAATAAAAGQRSAPGCQQAIELYRRRVSRCGTASSATMHGLSVALKHCAADPGIPTAAAASTPEHTAEPGPSAAAGQPEEALSGRHEVPSTFPAFAPKGNATSANATDEDMVVVKSSGRGAGLSTMKRMPHVTAMQRHRPKVAPKETVAAETSGNFVRKPGAQSPGVAEGAKRRTLTGFRGGRWGAGLGAARRRLPPQAAV